MVMFPVRQHTLPVTIPRVIRTLGGKNTLTAIDIKQGNTNISLITLSIIFAPRQPQLFFPFVYVVTSDLRILNCRMRFGSVQIRLERAGQRAVNIAWLELREHGAGV
jgi:hypothetical protein